jgi:hypothetical protein
VLRAYPISNKNAAPFRDYSRRGVLGRHALEVRADLIAHDLIHTGAVWVGHNGLSKYEMEWLQEVSRSRRLLISFCFAFHFRRLSIV